MYIPTILLLRHGQTEWNLEERYQGQLDSPLTPKGREQSIQNAHKLRPVLDSMEGVKIFSSPLGRARLSAQIICDELKVSQKSIIFDDRIQEFSYGVFEGKTKYECRELYPKEFEAREADKWSYLLEDGESYDIVTQRLKRWVQDIQGEELIVMVAHEMINRALRGLYLGLSNEETLRLRQANDHVLMLKNGKEYKLH